MLEGTRKGLANRHGSGAALVSRPWRVEQRAATMAEYGQLVRTHRFGLRIYTRIEDLIERAPQFLRRTEESKADVAKPGRFCRAASC
jgi:hypothetical protein